MRNFLDTFIDMKIDECEESIKQTTAMVGDIKRRLNANLWDDEYMELLSDEFADLVIRRHRLRASLNRLYKQLQKRNIESMVNDPDLNKE